MAQPRNKSEFARLTGVSRAGIQYACKPGSLLAPAVMDNGKIDADHPAAKKYLAKHGVAEPEPEPAPEPTPEPDPAPKKPKKGSETPRNQRGGYAKRRNEIEAAPAPTPDPQEQAAPAGGHAVPDRIEPFADLTVREVIERWGSEAMFKDWLASLKLIEEVRDKRLKNMAYEGKLISRDLVDKNIMGAIDEAMTRLLNDAAKTIAAQTQASAKAGNPVETIQSEVRDVMESHIKSMKAKATRALRDVQ